MTVSVVLPTYNEARNIVPLITEIRKKLPWSWTSEFLVINNNSTDGTLSSVEAAFGMDATVKSIPRTSDRSLAKSIRQGIENAHGEYLLVMDTDFTHRPDEIPLMLHVVREVDLVSGSRSPREAGCITRPTISPASFSIS